MKLVRALIGFAALAAVLAVASACGGDDDDPAKYQGAAASVVAQYWEQERAADQLPQGQNVRSVGSQGIRPLDSGDADARICVEFRYVVNETPFDAHTRVYVATLEGDGWSVEAVKDDGTCEDDDVA